MTNHQICVCVCLVCFKLFGLLVSMAGVPFPQGSPFSFAVRTSVGVLPRSPKTGFAGYPLLRSGMTSRSRLLRGAVFHQAIGGIKQTQGQLGQPVSEESAKVQANPQELDLDQTD